MIGAGLQIIRAARHFLLGLLHCYAAAGAKEATQLREFYPEKHYTFTMTYCATESPVFSREMMG